MTTIENLPAETIVQILKSASQFELQRDNYNVPTTVLHSSKVSRRWRSITIQTPELYTDIIIPFRALRERKYSIPKWTKFWFVQSKGCPVTVTIRFHPTHWGGQNEDRILFRDLLFDYIIPHASRLRGFHFVCAHKDFQGQLISMFEPLRLSWPLEAPILEELSIRTAEDEVMIFFNNSAPRHPIPLFQSTPKLRKLVLHGASDTMVPSLTRLTSLDIRVVTLSDASFRKLVVDCPELEFLALRSIYLTNTRSSSSSRNPLASLIPMNSLRSLILDFDASDIVDSNRHKHVFAQILAPNLEYLEISPGSRVVNLTNLLPVPSSLTNLKKLKLAGVTQNRTGNRRMGPNGTEEVRDDSEWFRELPDTIEEIHLLHTSGEVLGIKFPTGRHRKLRTGDDLTLQNLPPTLGPFSPPTTRSKDVYHLLGSQHYDSVPLSCSPSESSRQSSDVYFPNIKTITIESFVAGDMVWLCRLLNARPNIKTVNLSVTALMALRASVALKIMKDEKPGSSSAGWVVGIRQLGYMAYRWDEEDGEENINIEEWMRERVQLNVLNGN
ncbi:hypothetical protein L218DRAFT_304031 [Marasmius fiardii PR-910]|nr:hypothetical protein L218DRAFT_304031 [Marasmius fiardii PR-910]